MSQQKPSIFKSILAVLAGTIAGVVALFLIQTLSGMMYPLPEGIDKTDMAALGEHIKVAPTGAWVMLFLSFAGSALVAGYVGSRLAPRIFATHGVIAVIALVIAEIMTFSQLGMPTWSYLAMLAVFFLFGLAGARLGLRSHMARRSGV